MKFVKDFQGFYLIWLQFVIIFEFVLNLVKLELYL